MNIVHIPAGDDEEPAIPFRIQFATPIVKPQELPGFPYIATRIEFGAILYTAIVRAPDADAALDRLSKSWPNAEVRYVEENAREFKSTDQLKHAEVFGATVQPKGFFARWKNG